MRSRKIGRRWLSPAAVLLLAPSRSFHSTHPSCEHAASTTHVHGSTSAPTPPATPTPTTTTAKASPAADHHHHANDGHHHHEPLPTRRPIDTIDDAVNEARLVLPFQAILENFVHQNPLSEFEQFQFERVVAAVHAMELVLAPGERVFHLTANDPRDRADEATAWHSSAFLERGAAKWSMPDRHRGFLFSFASYESLGFAPWRKHARQVAKKLLVSFRGVEENDAAGHRAIAEGVIEEFLEHYGVEKAEWLDNIRALLLEIRGWAGMFHRMESVPAEAPADAAVRVIDFLAVRCILLDSSIRSMTRRSTARTPMREWIASAPKIRPLDLTSFHQKHVSALSYRDQHVDRRKDLEGVFKHALVEAIGTRSVPAPGRERPKLQVWTCMDDREESLRRHVEDCNPQNIETFGVAGFFGCPVLFQPVDGRETMVLAPVGNVPVHTLVEQPSISSLSKFPRWQRRRQWFGRALLWWEVAMFNPLQSLLLSAVVAPICLTRLMMYGFTPLLNQKIATQLETTVTSKIHTDFDIPYSVEEATQRLAGTLKDIGCQTFAKLVVVIGHGNTSVNNPFAAAYNCGACQGRHGMPNARLVCRIANDPRVRRMLQEEYDIEIPDDTFFLPAAHNTCNDQVQFYDQELMPRSLMGQYEEVTRIFERACSRNAIERCYRFFLDNPSSGPDALNRVASRSADFSEVRPELNHATNAAVVVGRRDLTKGRFLDRRAFLCSYDPFHDDDTGTNLEHVLRPALLVCSGINLEYYFSTIDTYTHGAGTKVPLNVVGNIGVLQGTRGDLRPGLPTQMTEMHVPIRATFVVDAPVSRVKSVLSRSKQLDQLVRNEWVRFLVRDPHSNVFFKQVQGQYIPIESNTSNAIIPFEMHRIHGEAIATREKWVYRAGLCAMVASCVLPLAHHYHLMELGFMGAVASVALDPYGACIAIGGTLLSIPTLAFAKRYLHGEHLFGYFTFLCASLVLGFNLVATAPTLAHALNGWSLFGFASTFLIGAYCHRPLVRNNATFAFASYRLGDIALLTAATFSSLDPIVAAEFAAKYFDPGEAAAAGVLLAAFFKSSQFPLTRLFARSMEGPTPSSALGYAGLSAHIGVVLLATTTNIWFPYDSCRMVVGFFGLFTSVYASMIAKITPDRKGSLAYATSASLGLIFVVLALGHPHIALMLSLGHAAMRMNLVLRAPNIIADSRRIDAMLRGTNQTHLGSDTFRVNRKAYRAAWVCNRIDEDFHLINILTSLSARLGEGCTPWTTSTFERYVAIVVVLLIVGAPWTPLSDWWEHYFMHHVTEEPAKVAVMALMNVAISVIAMRLLFTKILGGLSR